jgi:FkbM family methyltransferase
VLKKILRDNAAINLPIRKIIRAIHTFVTPLDRLTSLYRVYGVVNLNILDVSFNMYSKSDDHIVNEIFYFSDYEKSEFRLIKELTKMSKYFIDVGANTGVFSIFAAASNPTLSIISFEPHPGNFKRLITNIALNKLQNITLYQNALGSSTKDLEFTIPSDESISTTASANENYVKNFHDISYCSIAVKQRTIDELFVSLPLTSRDTIKLDVEYYELEVLKGARSTLANKRPMVMIEILQYESLIKQFPAMRGKINENHADEVFELFHDLGYHGYSIGLSKLEYITTIKGQTNRNFLFLSRKLSQNTVSYGQIESELIQANRVT